MSSLHLPLVCSNDKHDKPINYLEFQNQQLLMRFLEQAAISGNILTVGKKSATGEESETHVGLFLLFKSVLSKALLLSQKDAISSCSGTGFTPAQRSESKQLKRSNRFFLSNRMKTGGAVHFWAGFYCPRNIRGSYQELGSIWHPLTSYDIRTGINNNKHSTLNKPGLCRHGAASLKQCPGEMRPSFASDW